MNEICKGNPNPRLNTKTKLGRVMKLTSIPLFVFTTGVYTPQTCALKATS